LKERKAMFYVQLTLVKTSDSRKVFEF
jgi:hypothetical protein